MKSFHVSKHIPAPPERVWAVLTNAAKLASGSLGITKLEGGMPLGLFRGVRTFTLKPAEGGVQFEMTEAFSGLMAGLITKSIPDLAPSFERFANGLSALAQEKQ